MATVRKKEWRPGPHEGPTSADNLAKVEVGKKIHVPHTDPKTQFWKVVLNWEPTVAGMLIFTGALAILIRETYLGPHPVISLVAMGILSLAGIHGMLMATAIKKLDDRDRSIRPPSSHERLSAIR